MAPRDPAHDAVLREVARRAMLQRGLLPDFSPEALAETDAILGAAAEASGAIRDLRGLRWASEGKVVRGFERLDVGDRVRVQLVHTDVARGHIDFVRAREGT